MTILASDDGHGVISFNNSEHFLLREPTFKFGISESVAELYVFRNPSQGTFGTVSVQFSVADSNGSLNTSDLMPSEGFVVLEDGVRFKVSFILFYHIKIYFFLDKGIFWEIFIT